MNVELTELRHADNWSPIVGEIVKLDMTKIEINTSRRLYFRVLALHNIYDGEFYKIRYLKDDYVALSTKMNKVPIWVKDVIVNETTK